MEYTKIKVLSKDDPKRFYRVLAIKDNPDLYTLGAIIGSSIGAWFEHLYYFRKGKSQFVPDIWLEDDFFFNDNKAMSDSHLSDLGDKFIFEYDTGESWEFECKVLKSKYKYDSRYDEPPLGLVLEGKGQGIFENDHHTLRRYLDGEIDPNSDEENEDIGQFLPMNLEFEKYGDFDIPLNTDLMVYFSSDIEDITDQFNIDSQRDEEEDPDIMLSMILNQVAGDIFNDMYVNNIFRNLIKKHDINDAYDMIVRTTLELLTKYPTQIDPEAFEKDYHIALSKLK